MAHACLARLWPLDPVTNCHHEVRVCSANVRSVTGIGDGRWQPAMRQSASFGSVFWNGDFTDAVSTAEAQFTLTMDEVAREFSAANRSIWIGARVDILTGRPGSTWPWPVRFRGRVTSAQRRNQLMTVRASVDQEPLSANVLNLTYAGTGGREGGADLKDKVKPLIFGRALNVEPLLIDSVANIYQFSGYGPI
jgi:hypothetical protein